MKRPNSRQTGHAHRDRFRRQRIEDDIDAAAAGQFHDGLGEIAAPRVDDVPHAQAFEERAFGGAARAGDHFRAKVMGDLNRCHADSAGSGMHEHAFALPHAGDVIERVPGGHEDDRDRRSFLKGEMHRE